MLDFLQLDMKVLYNTYELIEVNHLPLKWLVRILPTELDDPEEVMCIYKRVVSEETLDDPELFNWLEQAMEPHKDVWPLGSKYKKLMLIKGLKNRDYSLAVAMVEKIGHGYVPSFIIKICLKYNFLGKDAFLQYTEWMFEMQQKNKYDISLMKELPREF